MDILQECVSAIRESTMKIGAGHVKTAIASLQGRNMAVIAADRTWLFNFVVGRPDQRWKTENLSLLSDIFLAGDITEEEIWRWIDEALSGVPVQELPDLPEKEGGAWYAVMIEGKYYCCSCRSLYEGEPLTEGEVRDLHDGDECDMCAACGINL